RGVEVFYSEQDKDFTQFLFEKAKYLKLLITGGSDFHGLNKPDIKLGKGFGNLSIPYTYFEELYKALTG
ncbi:MAG: phosphoesterase, partial [Caldimicrobium sp.]